MLLEAVEPGTGKGLYLTTCLATNPSQNPLLSVEPWLASCIPQLHQPRRDLLSLRRIHSLT